VCVHITHVVQPTLRYAAYSSRAPRFSDEARHPACSEVSSFNAHCAAFTDVATDHCQRLCSSRMAL